MQTAAGEGGQESGAHVRATCGGLPEQRDVLGQDPHKHTAQRMHRRVPWGLDSQQCMDAVSYDKRLPLAEDVVTETATRRGADGNSVLAAGFSSKSKSVLANKVYE